MKINMPVTDTEYPLTESDSIVSKTDLKGIITYINEDFLRVSGFSKEELIGTSHNIVRHPDMPPEAFADMWRVLKENRPWTGIVKNRCKNGDFYWVLANSTPYYESDRLAGYMSVRSKPSREQVHAAEAAYRLFKEGKAGNLIIQDGKVIKSTWLGKLNPFKHATIKMRLINVIGLLSILMMIIGGMGLHGMNKANSGLRSVYEDRTVPMNRISTIKELMLSNQLKITTALAAPTPEAIQKNVAEVEQNIATISSNWSAYMTTYLTEEEKALADRFTADRAQFVAEGLKPTLAALKTRNIELANQLVESKIAPLFNPASEDLKQLMQLQVNTAKQEFELAQARYNTIRNISIGLIALGIAMALWRGFTLIRVIVRPLNDAIDNCKSMAQGNYNNLIEIEHRDEIGKVMEALKSMQSKLGFDFAESKRIADESLRIKVGLDNVSTGVMIADNNRNIIYVNKSVVKMLGKAETDIRKHLPDFSVADLVGTNIDTFHVNPAHQERLLSNLTDSYLARMEIGGHSMVVTASPVINEMGQRLGAIAEWQDRTAEVAVEKEVADIVQGAALGNFTKRIKIDHKEGFFRQLGENLNQLMETSETGLTEVARVLEALSRGDLTEKITADYSGTFGQLKNDSNITVEKLKEIVNNIKSASDHIHSGAKEIAAGNNDLSHRTEQQAASLEETAASMEQLTSTVQQNSDNAQHANELALNASDIAGKGVQVIGKVVTTMDDINEASRKIGNIISVIDDIAFQTNILALNAAVEAARAGEQGKGFAVVAIEVRNLAQRAATAAGEIKHLIDDSVMKVSGGSKLVTQAGRTMEEIVNSIQGVTLIMSEISAASMEQKSGIEQVHQAIGQMDSVTQQNAALVEQAAAAAESLEEQARNLVNTVGSFKVDNSSNKVQLFLQQVQVANKETRMQKSFKTAAAAQPKLQTVNLDDEWEEF
jgi:methyl-accepting chemotaxis protein